MPAANEISGRQPAHHLPDICCAALLQPTYRGERETLRRNLDALAGPPSETRLRLCQMLRLAQKKHLLL
eukprot:9143809-Lingulodinium_polyedra.AAC.1